MQVWPRNMIPTFFPNFRGEVWLQPGKAPTQAECYRTKQPQQPPAAGAEPPAGPAGGSIAVVLGEGGHGVVVNRGVGGGVSSISRAEFAVSPGCQRRPPAVHPHTNMTAFAAAKFVV